MIRRLRRALYITVAAVLLIIAAFCSQANAQSSGVVDKFKESFNAALKEAGKDYGTCEFKDLGQGPDGEGGTATAVGVSCERAPFVCVFLVRLNANGEAEMKPLKCLLNPLFDDTPKQSI